MNDKIFVDTNILIYAHDSDAGDRHLKAREAIKALWDNASGVLSTQVLQEFYIIVRRKIPQPLSAAKARGIIESYFAWEIVHNSPASILRASEIEVRHRLSFWDALIICAAMEANAASILTEDLNHGQLVESVRIVNPFVAGSLSWG